MGERVGRRALAEFIGTALLVIAVIGSGIAASRLSGHDSSLALFENAVATGAALVAIILAVGPVSGAHLNPVISLLDWLLGGLTSRATAVYLLAQLAGGFAGAVLANLMFGLSAVQLSAHVRSGGGLWLGEAIATFGLALVVFGAVRSGRSSLAPFAVGAYIAGAYFFTSSTSFANPAVTFGRMFSNTFTGIAPASAGTFIGFQLVGGTIAWATIRTLYPGVENAAQRVVVPHGPSAAVDRETRVEVLEG